MIYNLVNALVSSLLIGSSSFFTGKEVNYNLLHDFEIHLTTYCGVSCPEHLKKKISYAYNGYSYHVNAPV